MIDIEKVVQPMTRTLAPWDCSLWWWSESRLALATTHKLSSRLTGPALGEGRIREVKSSCPIGHLFL